jgi:hypothetical protein
LIIQALRVSDNKRSRANWLQHGNRNTPFSHQFASAWRKKNQIKKFKAGENKWIEGTEQLKPLIYFTNIFTSEVQHID